MTLAPDSLVEFFKSLSIKKPDLSITTMVWVPGFYLNFGRQKFKDSRWSDKLPPNFAHFRDKSPYLFGSRHEKYAIIDNTLFVGGMDITSGRYDDRDHQAHFQTRRLPGGKKYKPRHDVQLMVKGELNSRFFELPKERAQVKATTTSKQEASNQKRQVHFFQDRALKKNLRNRRALHKRD